MHCEDSKITNTNSLPCLQMTSIANQNKKNLQKKRRFNLEIQTGGHDNQTFLCDHECLMYDCIQFKAVFQIHCSHSMLTAQPDYCGTCNTAKSCTEHSIII